jgi:hypothetical protein
MPMHYKFSVSFIDDEGSIIVPKSVRPTIDYEVTHLGDKKGARQQFRHKNLHIRDYGDYYTVHIDNIDPRKDPLGHLIIDAPEFLVGIMSAVSIGKLIGPAVGKSKRFEADKKENQLSSGIAAGCIIGSAAVTSYMATIFIKRIIKRGWF